MFERLTLLRIGARQRTRSRGCESGVGGLCRWCWNFRLWIVDCGLSDTLYSCLQSAIRIANPQSIIRRRRPVVAQVDLAEPVDGLLQALAEGRSGLPAQV